MATEVGMEAIEPWIEGVMAKMKPGERIKIARKIGQTLRARNTARIRANVQPDGSPMEKRKPRMDKRGRIRGRKGKMFPKIAMARNMRVTARQDEVSLSFSPLVASAAKVHHFGLTDHVENKGESPRVRYPARPLLGITSEDRDEILSVVMKWLEK